MTTPDMNIVRCPKCGDPSPWHRDTCVVLTTSHEDREQQVGVLKVTVGELVG